MVYAGNQVPHQPSTHNVLLGLILMRSFMYLRNTKKKRGFLYSNFKCYSMKMINVTDTYDMYLYKLCLSRK